MDIEMLFINQQDLLKLHLEPLIKHQFIKFLDNGHTPVGSLETMERALGILVFMDSLQTAAAVLSIIMKELDAAIKHVIALIRENLEWVHMVTLLVVEIPVDAVT